MSRRICYIAAPYAAEEPELIRWHVARACALATLATRCGLAPIVVHPAIGEVYGDVESPDARALGLEVDCAIVAAVAQSGGRLWLLLDDDCDMSAGCAAELEAWKAAGGPTTGEDGHLLWQRTWEGWRRLSAGAGLADLHHHLSRPPTGPTWWAHLRALRQWGQP